MVAYQTVTVTVLGVFLKQQVASLQTEPSAEPILPLGGGVAHTCLPPDAPTYSIEGLIHIVWRHSALEDFKFGDVKPMLSLVCWH